MKNLSSRIFRTGGKKYMTETEHSDTTDSKPKKQSFNVKNVLYNIEEKRKKELRILAFKTFTFSLAVLQIFLGHFYCAVFILWSASMLHIEVISLGAIVKKDNMIEYSWLDFYWYVVSAYITVPQAFLRSRMIRDDVYFQSEIMLLLLY